MLFKYPQVIISGAVIIGIAIVLSWAQPEWFETWSWLIGLVGILLIGLPHGASDLMVFDALKHRNEVDFSKAKFILYYLLMILIYGVIWYLTPLFALIVFMIISAYHFGESAWLPLTKEMSAAERFLIFVISGLWVLLVPIFFHVEVSSGIIMKLINAPIPIPSPTVVMMIILANTVGLFFVMAYLYYRGYILKSRLKIELINYVLLFILFTQTSLLFGFAIYFIWWHSIPCVKDQIQWLNKNNLKLNWKKFYLKTLPVTLITLLFLAVWVVFFSDSLILSEYYAGYVFSFIAAITVPHTLLIDYLYKAHWH